jgi:hypothetical protein
MLGSTLRAMTLAFFVISASGCKDKVPWIDLPNSQDSTYKLSLKTYNVDEAVSRPFHLGVRSLSKNYGIKEILLADQCKNVEVFQNNDALLIFYDELSLEWFSGYSLGEDIPRAQICDNSQRICQDLRSALVKSGATSVAVCTLK